MAWGPNRGGVTLSVKNLAPWRELQKSGGCPPVTFRYPFLHVILLFRKHMDETEEEEDSLPKQLENQQIICMMEVLTARYVKLL